MKNIKSTIKLLVSIAIENNCGEKKKIAKIGNFKISPFNWIVYFETISK